MSNKLLSTPLTELLNIQHPIILAGMGNVSRAELVAAVTNSGGLGVLGGITLTPTALRKEIQEIKSLITLPDKKFGVDLLLPKLEGNRRATNKDYTKNQLEELIDIIIEEKATLFVCAVGACPQWISDKLHQNNILVANMIGLPQHCDAVIDRVDMLMVTGGEGGGHCNNIATLPLVRQCVERVQGKISKFTGKPIMVVGGGGVVDGASLAAVLMLGAVGGWIGTRFICATESGATVEWQRKVIESEAKDTIRSLVVTGRPLRLIKTPYYAAWDTPQRQLQAEELCSQGIIPLIYDKKEQAKNGNPLSPVETKPYFAGQCVGSIKKIQPAAEIIHEMVTEAVDALNLGRTYVVIGDNNPNNNTSRL
jgi:NAD(P)H-dependent flavin oxidoreductase YrpB (nitropropane dioxygenase family)